MSQSRNDDFKRGAAILCNALATIDEADQYGRTQLWWATFHGDTDVVKVLIGLGANVDNKGMGVVSYHEEERKYIISTDIYGPQRGIAEIAPLSPSLVAAVLGNHEILRQLLDAGAVVDQSLDGCSLFAAAASGHKEVCELLFHVANWHKITVSASLGGAAGNGHAGIAEMMIHAGADVDFKTSKGNSNMFLASYQGNKEVVELLINAGADVKSKNNNGQSSLYVASYHGHREVVEVLISAGADVESKDNNGQSSLFNASSLGHREVVEVLINAGADVESKDNDGISSLLVASNQGHREVVEVLIKARADVESKDNNGQSSLFAASIQGHREVVEVLINAGADVESTNNDGRSSLFAASFLGHREVVEVLINAGADVESVDYENKTALMKAAENGHCDTVRILIENGAKIPRDLLSIGIKSCNNDLVNYLVNIDNLVINNPLIGKAIELAIQRDLVGLLQKLVRRSHYSSDAGDCSLRVYRMLMILADDGTKTPQPPPIVEFLDGQYQYFKGGFSITEHCSPGPHPIPNTPDLDVNLIIKRSGIGSIEYAPMGMAEIISEKVDCTVQDLVKNIPAAAPFIPVESIERCGSTAEGTSVGLPDEYDYLLKVTEKYENCELVDHGHGYMYISLESRRIAGMLRRSKFFHDLIWAGLREALAEIRKIEDVAIEDIPNVQDGGSASTEIKIKCTIPGTNHLFRVSVDCVPVIHFKNAWPQNGILRTWLMDKEMLKLRGFALVAKPPHKKSKMGNAMEETDRVKLYRLSCSHLEAEHIASLDARVRNAFIAAKCIRNPEVCRIFMKESDGVLHEVDHYLTTYLLKTVFLHNVEDFLATEKTLLHMVYIIYNELEVCLAKEFLPNFWENHVNVLEGLSIDAKKSLQVARLMKRLIGRWYDAEEVGVSEGATASSSEDAPSVGYHAYEFDDVE